MKLVFGKVQYILLTCMLYAKPSYCAFYKEEGLKKIQSDKFSSFLKTF